MSRLMSSLPSDGVLVSTASRSVVSIARYDENSAANSSSAKKMQPIEIAAPPSVRSLNSSLVFGKKSARRMLIAKFAGASERRRERLRDDDGARGRRDDGAESLRLRADASRALLRCASRGAAPSAPAQFSAATCSARAAATPRRKSTPRRKRRRRGGAGGGDRGGGGVELHATPTSALSRATTTTRTTTTRRSPMRRARSSTSSARRRHCSS